MNIFRNKKLKNTEAGRGLLSIILFIAIAYGAYYLYSTKYAGKINLTQVQSDFESLVGQLVEKFKQTADTTLSQINNAIPTTDTTSTNNSFSINPLNTTQQNNPIQHKQSTSDISRDGIISETNKNRIQNALAPLTENSLLTTSANQKAEDMLTRQYFEHTAPDGKTAGDLITATGYIYLREGENLARGDFKTDTELVDAWMASPGHRENILRSGFTEIGIGIARGTYQGQETYMVVQHFAAPRSLCPSINESIKTQFESGSAEINSMEKELELLRTSIEEGRKQGKSMNDEADIYNQKLLTYQKKYSEVDALRVVYNTQVSLFNACLKSTGSQ